MTGRRSTSVVAPARPRCRRPQHRLGIVDAVAGDALLRDHAPGGRLAALWQHVTADGRVTDDQTSNWPAIVGARPRRHP